MNKPVTPASASANRRRSEQPAAGVDAILRRFQPRSASNTAMSIALRYGGAVLAVAAAAALRWLLQDDFGNGVAFITFFPTVALVAMFAGGGPGLLATALSAAAVGTWIGFGTHGAGEGMAMSLFILAGLVMSVTAEMLRRARRRELSALEGEVAERGRSLRTLSRAVEQSPASIVITDPAGIIEYVNPRFTEITGYSQQEVLGRNPRLLKSGHQPVEFYRDLWETISAGRDWRGEFCNRKKNGEEFWESAVIAPIHDENGAIVQFMAIKQDITERKRAEQQMAAELQAMTRLQEIGSLFVREGELEPVLGEVVEAAKTIAGADFGNIQLLDPKTGDLQIVAQRGFPLWWLDHWNAVSKGKGACGTALERGERVIVEDVERSPIFAGTPELDIQLRAGVRAVQSTPLLSRTGTLLGMFSTHYKTPHRPDARTLWLLDLLARQAADMIDRSQIEAAFHEHRDRLRAILNTVADAVITIDSSGTIVELNPAAERMFGYSASEMQGRNVKMLMPGQFARKHDHYINHYHRTGKARIIGIGREALGRRKNGTEFPIELAVGEIDHLHMYVGVVRDITERKRMEVDLLKISEREQHRIGMDLHDGLGPQIAAISILNDALLGALKDKDLPEAAMAVRLKALLKDAGEQMRGIARGLMPVTADPNGLMAGLESYLRKLDDSRPGGARVTFACPAPVRVHDPTTATHLFRIVQEAVRNATSHAAPRHISVRLTGSDGRICIEVQDDGRGGDVETLKSNGLGLRTMQYRVGAMGGSLEILHPPEGGTAIRCCIPQTEAPTATP